MLKSWLKAELRLLKKGMRVRERWILGWVVGVLVVVGGRAGLAADPQPGAEAKRSAADRAESPQPLKPGDVGVGRRCGPLAWVDLEGRAGAWPASGEARWLVVGMTSTSCPLSRKYFPVLSRLAATYRPRGVEFLLVAPTATDVVADLGELVRQHEFSGRCVADPRSELAGQVRARTTTDIVVLDASGTVRYQGAVDDQYGLGYARDAAQHTFLVDALERLLAGRAPLVAATTAPGCELESATSPPSRGAVTYYDRVARLVRANCEECHRAGGLGPFALSSYDDLVAHQAMIRRVVEQGTMPPWFAEPLPRGAPARWSNERSLSAEERADLLSWLQHGVPAGEPSQAPPPLPPASAWQIGTPDLVLELPREVRVKAEGTMPYQTLLVETRLTEDRWVEALEVRPSARDVVHHVLVFVAGDRGGGGEEREADERRGFFAAYVPGNSVFEYPPGFAKRLPRGARLLFQMHYTPNGTATADRTQLGLRFAKSTPRHEVESVGIANTHLRIPPRAERHEERATLRVPQEAAVLAFLPHMHLRGKAFQYRAAWPDGRQETLLNIPRYDFNWQLQYRLSEPLTVPAGTTLEVVGWFDNSARNPANPDPERTVGWGPQTYDEMLLGYVEYYLPGKTPGETSADEKGPASGAARVRVRVQQALFRRADADGNGQLELAEARTAFGSGARYRNRPELLERHFRWLDQDQDGRVSADEFERVNELRD